MKPFPRSSALAKYNKIQGLAKMKATSTDKVQDDAMTELSYSKFNVAYCRDPA
jgi:hypothetical protein